jgi:Wzt C-terminal domain
MRDDGKTILFVTHDMGAVQRFCHRALLLERGNVIAIGEPKEIADRYLRLSFEGGGLGPGDELGRERAGNGAARVVEAWMEDESGARQSALPQGRPCAFRALVRFGRAVDDPSFAVAFVNPQRQNVFVASSSTVGERSGSFEAGEAAQFSVSFENALAPGRYAVSTLISRPDAEIVDRWESIFTFVVTGARAAGGLVDLAHDFALERTDTTVMAPEAK